MSRREMTWLEAATFTLENTSKIWMTAPELVREIEAKGYRSLRSKYNQAVRTLRATLNVQSRKEDGMFLRVEENFHVQFALKKRLTDNNVGGSNPAKPRQVHSERRSSVKEKAASNKEKTKQSSKTHKPLTNGISSPTPLSPHTPHLPSSPKHILAPSQPLTVEIDPTTKPGRHSSSSKDSPSGFCLPSPLHSLLGPMRTLHVLSESATPPTSTRPVRQVRKKKHFDQENDAPNGNLSNGVPENVNSPPPLFTSSLSKLPEILRLEVCHQLPSFLSDVTCVRYESSSSLETDKTVRGGLEDPCLVQGDRECTGSLEIDPDYVGTRSETDDDDDDLDSYESGSMSDYDSESDFSDTMHIQPTPTNQLFVRKPMRRFTGTYGDINSESLIRETESCDSEASALPETTKQSSEESFSVAPPQRYSQRERTSSRSETTQMKSPLRTSGTTNSDLNRIQSRMEQRRSISSLLAPISPLVNENMKSLLNLDSFKGLSVVQKKRLINHLPSVDRDKGSSILEESLTNSFFSSALREWQERVALGVHTPEYRARLRGEEKRRASLRPDDPWKHKHFEQSWGEKSQDTSESVHSTPYYPHFPSSSPHQKQILTAIVDGYCRKVPESDPPDTSASSSTSSSSTTLNSSQLKTNVDETQKPVEPVPTTPPKLNLKLQKRGAKPPPKSKSSSSISQKNHIVSKITQTKEKKLLSSLLTTKSQKPTNKTVNKKPALKRLGANSLTPPKAVVAKVQQRGNSLSGEFLTRLPPKTPYQALLNMLIHMSKTVTPVATVKSPTYLPPLVEHNHAVFHDHFALLSSEHIPTEFSLPVKSLPVQLPLEVYQSCLKQKAIHSDHCYARMSGESPPKVDDRSLKLSLPRSLIRTSDSCACGGQPLVLCSECCSLYHSVCSQSTLCQTCSTLASLNLT